MLALTFMDLMEQNHGHETAHLERWCPPHPCPLLQRPHPRPHSHSHTCAQHCACALALPSPPSTSMLGLILIGTNLFMLWFCANSVDHKRRVKTQTQVEALFDEVQASDFEDRVRYESSWKKLVSDAPAEAVASLYEKLRTLVVNTEERMGRGGAQVVQPPSLSTVEALVEATEAHNDAVHAFIGAIVAECDGAVYDPGPIKSVERIQAKADADYGKSIVRSKRHASSSATNVWGPSFVHQHL